MIPAALHSSVIQRHGVRKISAVGSHSQQALRKKCLWLSEQVYDGCVWVAADVSKISEVI